MGTLPSKYRELAACKGKSIRLFFPKGNNTVAVNKAKAICESCQVKDECLKAALDTPEEEDLLQGILGGTTAAERTIIRRRPPK